MKDLIDKSLRESQKTLETFLQDETTAVSIEHAAKVFIEALASGRKIISCGNGGSLCDAVHFAEELTGRYRNNRRSLPAIAINDPAYLTCTANDFSFEEVFSRYVEGVGASGDVLLSISTSGCSSNVIRAARTAKELGMKVVSLTGPSGNPLANLSDVAICAPEAPHSDRIQEIHIKVIHILVQAIEAGLGL